MRYSDGPRRLWPAVLLTVLVWLVVAAGWMLGFGRQAATYHNGTPTTARFDRCAEDSVCTAVWRLDGEEHSGPVYGGGEQSGSTLRVVATTSYAATPEAFAEGRRWAIAGVVVLLAATGVIWARPLWPRPPRREDGRDVGPAK